MARKGTPPAGAKKKDKAVALIGRKTLNDLLKFDDSRKGIMDGANGELREAIANAVDKKHLHKKAYVTVKAMHRFKSDEALKLYVENLLAYMDMAGITKRIEAVGDLPLGEEADSEDEVAHEQSDAAPKKGGGGGEVVKFGQAAAPSKH